MREKEIVKRKRGRKKRWLEHKFSNTGIRQRERDGEKSENEIMKRER